MFCFCFFILYSGWILCMHIVRFAAMHATCVYRICLFCQRCTAATHTHTHTPAHTLIVCCIEKENTRWGLWKIECTGKNRRKFRYANAIRVNFIDASVSTSLFALIFDLCVCFGRCHRFTTQQTHFNKCLLIVMFSTSFTCWLIVFDLVHPVPLSLNLYSLFLCFFSCALLTSLSIRSATFFRLHLFFSGAASIWFS